ncbi:hypothetical protein CN091_08960 [Sinorhizobium meliloti]|nr:hypothetical protein CN091_08960 [Sinorhizobium meliloti]
MDTPPACTVRLRILRAEARARTAIHCGGRCEGAGPDAISGSQKLECRSLKRRGLERDEEKCVRFSSRIPRLTILGRVLISERRRSWAASRHILQEGRRDQPAARVRSTVLLG